MSIVGEQVTAFLATIMYISLYVFACFCGGG